MDNADLIKRFLDMANCADACYAKGLEYVTSKKNKEDPKEIADDDESDGSTLGYINPDNDLITTYARAIEAGFNEEKVIKEDWFSNTTLDNDITNIPKDTPHDQISQRTKDFVSRFELVKHQENTKINDFSATLFKDVGQKYILKWDKQ